MQTKLLAYKLLKVDGTSLDGSHAYTLDGQLQVISGNGGYFAVSGGLLTGGYGPLLALAIDLRDPSGAWAPPGVVCYREAALLPAVVGTKVRLGDAEVEVTPAGAIARRWYENGQLRYEELPNGTECWWHRNGKPHYERLPDMSYRWWPAPKR